ncbi:MAG: diaminopimelate epimerase [Acidobacteriota bacterium]|nr:diaminopimelate epimerase [Acidobacteriota bacterium]
MRLTKAHAYGNDFLFVPADEVDGQPLDDLSRRLCERQTGVGGDGVIYYTVLSDGSARMRLVNADGSPSELSGNGLRCLAALILHEREGEGEPISTLHVDTDAGWKRLTLSGHAGTRYTFRAAMGPPEHVTQETLDVAGERLPVVIMTMANPQCVALVHELPDRARFERLGPALSTHPRFSAGTNVEFAVVEAPDRVRILIWERGVGPTHASGTGACAAAVAAVVAGGAGRDIAVEAPGGTQRVEWRDDGVYLTGWAEVLFEGQWVKR